MPVGVGDVDEDSCEELEGIGQGVVVELRLLLWGTASFLVSIKWFRWT